ncbi:MAG: transcriptional regulator [Calditrichaeota bacterium]|mgnify:FL=1|jgi:predicted transcriptional regulator of viral defense system|nr:transcriptional regulator [Calditrichota bacterium]
MRKTSDRSEEAQTIFRNHGGILRMREALEFGITRTTLYSMFDSGLIERLHRGLYRLTDLPSLGNPDLVAVSGKAPNAIICLISALAFHEITTHIPHEVQIAIRRHTRPPRITYPPTGTFYFSEQAITSGVEKHLIDGTEVRIFSAAKTVADCFKYRNKIGLNVAVEALKMFHESRRLIPNEIMKFAAVCRVERVIRPYLGTLL